MNGILGFAEMLKGAAIPNTTKEEYLEIIEKSGSRMLNILNDLMAISRIESNQVEINCTRLNLNEQIDSLVKKFETEAASKGIQLIHHKAFSYEDAFVVTDKEKLYVVLFNLINNAIKYTNEGSVEFGYELNGKNLQFKVKDTGIGIDPDCLDIIFDRFVQADNSLSKPYEGAGLGLSIARAYAELLGGNIRVLSEKGKGSEFIFELPFKKEDQKNGLSAEKEKTAVPSEDEVLKNLTVLVAEDDEVGRIYLEQLLEGKCKKVFYAQNGKEAVGIYSRNPGIDLILMDIKMPVMDGYSATIRIRAIDHNAKIVAQTAYALSGDREKAIA
ncbi:MAG: ATP-binding protein, partial [Prolixibacteraceae bacterium]